MVMVNKDVEIFWTKKVKLDRIIDPLYLSGLKFVENKFIEGITTQTERVRYYSFLTWAWHVIHNNSLPHSTILNMEKVFTLICAYHHLGKKDYPRGIRNRQDGEKFLKENEFIDVSNFTKFGRNNKQGYGNYYYTGPLAALQILWKDENGIKFSNAGIKLAQIYDRLGHDNEKLFIDGRFEKKELAKLVHHCACKVRENREEIELWRKIFFGFTKKDDSGINFDEERFNKFMEGKDTIALDATESNRLRRLTLFAIMKIIHEAEPNKSELLQAIRDGFYFREVKKDNDIRRIDYTGLNNIDKQLAVYVHNLYFMDILEYTLSYIVDILKTKPQGATIEDVLNSLDLNQIKKHMGDILSIFEPERVNTDIVLKKIESFSISLREPINERIIFYDFINSKDKNRVFADLLVLLFLIKRRFNMFDEKQKTIIRDFDNPDANPEKFYKKIDGKPLSEILEILFTSVINCHRYATARKLLYDNTKAWLFTVEENKLFFYDKSYEFEPYVESKWTNVIELLFDLKLVDYDNERYILSEDGKIWISKIN